MLPAVLSVQNVRFGHRRVAVIPGKPELIDNQLLACLIELAAADDVMVDLFPHSFPTRLAGIGRHEADFFHHVGPLLVLVPSPARLPHLELMETHHLSAQNTQRELDRVNCEERGVQRDLRDHLVASVALHKPLARKVAEALVRALKREDAVLQLATEQLGVEEVESLLDLGVHLARGMLLLGHARFLSAWSGRISPGRLPPQATCFPVRACRTADRHVGRI